MEIAWLIVQFLIIAYIFFGLLVAVLSFLDGLDVKSAMISGFIWPVIVLLIFYLNLDIGD